MNVASSTRVPTPNRGATFSGPIDAVVALVATLMSSSAFAQAAVPLSRPEFLTVMAHLDALTIGLVVVAVLVVALLVWRVARMVRGETPVGVKVRRGAPVADRNDSLDRATDWGHDQNKRAALARSPVTITNTTVDLPSLDHAVTQWSITDVQRATSDGVQPDDALGKSPAAINSLYRTSFNPYFRRESPAPTMEVVEVADALLQAELLVQLGDPKQAMTLLSKHIRETEKPGPAVWLMLLGLYQSTGREAQYNALAAGFSVLFNADVPPWATSSDQLARDLESYPPVIARLQATWAGPTRAARSRACCTTTAAAAVRASR